VKNNRWKISLQLTGILIGLAALILGPWPQGAAAKANYSYDFEENVKPWTAGGGTFLNLDHSDSHCPFEVGAGMALLTTPGSGAYPVSAAAGGVGDTAYMGALFPAQTGDKVVVDWATKPQGVCLLGKCAPVIYAGAPLPPANLKWAMPKGSRLLDGWWSYHYETRVPAPATGAAQVYIALGVSAASELLGPAVGIDCVSVNIMPADQ
jgi:hypothetical protein